MKKLVIFGLSVLGAMSLLLFAGCEKSGADTEAAQIAADETYDYVYDRPFYSTPDDFMKIDGVFDEDAWKDSVWMQTTQFGVTYKVTTHFTQKGIYVAAYAEDKNIIFKGRNNFINNSSFEIQIVKEGTPVYSDVVPSASRWNQNFMDDFMFHADSKTCRSYRERNFNGAVKCVGTPNSGDTTSLSYEMFLGWDQMSLTKDEVNPETGIPDSVRMWCQYIVVDKDNSADTKYVSPFLMDYGIYPSYYAYGKNGIINRPDNGVVGSAIGGTTCTDRWIVDEATGALKVDQYQTQHIWFNHDKAGNVISRPKSFIADATVTLNDGGYSSGQATFGIMTIHDMWSMVTYGVNLNTLKSSGSVRLESIEGIDSRYWVGQQSMVKTVQNGYTENKISLRLIKIGGYYYYFYKSPSADEYTYVGYEYFYKNSEDVDVGLFTNCPSTITDYSVQNFTGRESALEDILGESVYKITTESSGGEVNLTDVVVKKGDGVTVTVTPTNGYVLETLTVNGADKFDEFKENGSLTFIPDSNTVIAAKFSRIPVENCKTVEFTVVDEAGNPVSNADYVIRSSNPLFMRTGTTSGRGAIRAVIPKECTFEINGKTYVSDGEYEIALTKTAYLDKVYAFRVADGDIAETITMQETRWGKSLSVNGKSITDRYGVLYYDEENNSYYAAGGSVREYYTDLKTVSGKYIYKALVKTAPTASVFINPVAGIVIYSGSADTTINLKSAWWEQNRLCVEINGKEISVSGFKHILNNNNKDSKFEITVARLNNALYVYDMSGELALILDGTGVHPVGGRQIVNNAGLSYVTAQLKGFFDNGVENICGPLAIDTRNARIDFDITLSETGVEETVKGGTINIEGGEYTLTLDKAAKDYLKGDNVTVYAPSKNGKIVTELKLTYNGGSKTISGNYDIVSGKTAFNFTHVYGDVTVKVNAAVDGDAISGTLTGASDYQSVVAVLGGALSGEYSGLIGADGRFSFVVPKGSLGIAFVCGGKLAVIPVTDTGAMTNLSASLTDNASVLGSVTLNGRRITSKATIDYETLQKIANGEKFAIKSDLSSNKFGSAERREYAAILTSSVSGGDITVTGTLSTDIAYGKSGLMITDGENMIAVQLGAGGCVGNLYVNYGAFNEGDRFDVKNSVSVLSGTPVTGHAFSDIALKLVKTSGGLKVYIDEAQFIEITNESLGEEFFVSGKEYCFGIVSTMLAGDIYNKTTIQNN